MATNRTRRYQSQELELTEAGWCWLTDQPLPGNTGDWERFFLEHDVKNEARRLWERYGAEVLRQWIRNYPGTRPRCWWKYSAPKPRRDGESERDYLTRLNLLLPDEVAH